MGSQRSTRARATIASRRRVVVVVHVAGGPRRVTACVERRRALLRQAGTAGSLSVWPRVSASPQRHMAQLPSTRPHVAKAASAAGGIATPSRRVVASGGGASAVARARMPKALIYIRLTGAREVECEQEPHRRIEQGLAAPTAPPPSSNSRAPQHARRPRHQSPRRLAPRAAQLGTETHRARAHAAQRRPAAARPTRDCALHSAARAAYSRAVRAAAAQRTRRDWRARGIARRACP